MIYNYLDPRTKIINIFAIVIILYNYNSVATFVLINIYILALILTSRQKKLYKIIFPFIPMFLIMIILNSITITTGTYVTSFLFVDIYTDAIKTTLLFFDRLILISLLTYTTIKSMTNSQIVSGFKFIFEPLKYIKFPVEAAALICAITLNFFPIVLEEIRRIRKAQIQRGLNYKANVIKRMINFKAIIVPTFTFSFSKAVNIGNALEIKGYEFGKTRSQYIKLKFKVQDFIIYFFLILMLVL